MNCLHCNKPIEGKRNTKKYCSNTCKQYAYLNRSFAMPITLNLDPIDKNRIIEEEKFENISNNSEEKKQQIKNNSFVTNLLDLPNKKQTDLNQYEEYQYVYPDVLDKIQEGYDDLKIGQGYFSKNENRGGRITDYNFTAFSYILPRIRCIIENLFQLSYKNKVHYKTVNALSMALEEMLLSEHMKTLPNNFPFVEDLIKLHEQFRPIAKSLAGDKEGIKFILNRAAITRYIMILYLIRNCTVKDPFQKLFPDLFKMSSS